MKSCIIIIINKYIYTFELTYHIPHARADLPYTGTTKDKIPKKTRFTTLIQPTSEPTYPAATG